MPYDYKYLRVPKETQCIIISIWHPMLHQCYTFHLVRPAVSCRNRCTSTPPVGEDWVMSKATRSALKRDVAKVRMARISGPSGPSSEVLEDDMTKSKLVGHIRRGRNSF